MCGIAGIVRFDGAPPLLEDLEGMCLATSHRGPDDCGFYVDRHAALGMCRLSIIDLETGRQPVRNEDGTVWVVFNGEIYNHREIRPELESRGHRFTTDSDTEVLVHLYEELGLRCVEWLRGMFAFALWDLPKRQILLARDRFGIKPLYYTTMEGRLAFASELKALTGLPGVRREINPGSLAHLFAFLSTPATESIIQGIRKLEPAHILVASPGLGFRTERYWDLEFRPDEARTERETIERLRAELDESVRLHMASDVPLGAFLSGGIDSSTVVATMSSIAAAPVKTFSIGFPDADYDELEEARLVARRFGTDHHELVVEPDVMGIVQELSWYLDEPFGDSSAIPTYMVSMLASRHVTVALSGDGGDEIFAGYDKYLVEKRQRRLGRLPAPFRHLLGFVARLIPEGVKGRNLLSHYALAGPRRYVDSGTLFRRSEMRKLFRPEVWESISRHDPWEDRARFLERSTGDWLSALQSMDLRHYLPLDILTKVDRMSMAHSLEARVPLLDHKLVEFVATIPPRLRINGGTTKYILKQAMRGVLPDAIIDKPKRGFAIPLGRWFRRQLAPYLRDILLSSDSLRRGYFEPACVESLIARHDQGRDMDLHLWTMLSFELWCRAYLDGRPGFRPAPRPPARPALVVRAPA